jgi:hypothetical protein
MPSWSPSSSVLIAFVIASNACMVARREATPPPTVASIPVAPMRAAAPHTPSAPEPAPSPAEGLAEPAPSAIASVVDPAAAAPPPARVVLVDELPYHWSHGTDHTHAHARKHGRGGRPYHPAPGIVVDLTQAQGGAPGAELLRAARSAGYWPFRRCYEEGLRRDQGLLGKVSFDLAVAASGAVDRASILSATLHDESVVLCIGREALHLGLPSAESPTRATLEVTLSTGDEPLSTPRPVAHADELREALRASWPSVEHCYTSELAKHPDAGGRLELRFRAKQTGEIVEVAEEGDPRFADVDVTRCVLGVYRTTRLPAVRVSSARETSFAYAMHFEARQ